MQHDMEDKARNSSSSPGPSTSATSTTTSAGSATRQPAWTQSMGNMPPAGVQVSPTPADQREFVKTAIDFLCSAAEFYRAGAVVDEDRLQRQLTHWREVLLGSLKIINTALNNDAGLEKDLKAAYKDAVQSLMNAAARQLKRDLRQLYAAYRDQIQEWKDLYPTATPVGKEAVLEESGSALLHIGRVTVIVKPDQVGQTKGDPADTFFQFDQWNIHYQARNNRVFDFNPPKLTMSIQTVYRPGVDPESRSGYGRGTTEGDIKEGRTTLKYHEGGHGKDFIQFLHDNPPPIFRGTKGMTPEAFERAIAQFNKDMHDYIEAMKAYSTKNTHCVGVTIDEYNHVHGVECK